MSRTAAILLAAGSSRRMAGTVADKVLAPLAGKPVFAHSAATFVRSGVIDFFAVTYRDRAQMLELSAYAPTPTVFVRGGAERTVHAKGWGAYGTLKITGDISRYTKAKALQPGAETPMVARILEAAADDPLWRQRGLHAGTEQQARPGGVRAIAVGAIRGSSSGGSIGVSGASRTSSGGRAATSAASPPAARRGRRRVPRPAPAPAR